MSYTASWYRAFLIVSVFGTDIVCHLLHYGIGPFFVQTLADISLVKYSHMCDLQHHGTDLFGAIYVGFSIKK